MIIFAAISFLCLGDWPALNGDRYIALMDLRDEPEARPKYRCGVSGIYKNKINVITILYTNKFKLN